MTKPDGQHSVGSITGAWIIPLAGFILVTTLTLLMLTEVKHALDLPIQQAINSAHWSVQDQARFAKAALIWAALGTAVLAALIVALAFSLWVLLRRTEERRGFRVTFVSWIVLFALLIWLREVQDSDSVSSIFNNLQGPDEPFTWPVRVFAIAANVLTAAVIASLFAAASAILVDLHRHGARAESLWADLRALLALGAVATVLGVLEIGALGAMGSAAVSAGGADTVLDGRLADQLAEELEQEITSIQQSDQIVDTPLLAQWAKEWAPDGVDKVFLTTVAKSAAARLAQEPEDAPDLRRSILCVSLKKQQKQLATAFEEVSAHRASFWGVAFTIALALLYLPASFIVVHEGRASGVLQAQQHRSVSEKIFAPLLRVALALAPLLVGTAADFLQAMQKVAGK